ncbi:MAG: glycosyltransferase family 4 protein [Bacteroidota bacterium]
MQRKRIILFFSHSAALYGAERSLLDLILGLDQTQFYPIVALPAEGPLADRLRTNNIEVRITGHQNWMGGKYFLLAAALRFGANLKTYFKLKKELADTPIDLVYTNTSATPMGGFIARVLGVPHLWHIREFIPKGTGGKFYYGTQRSFNFIQKAASTIVCNSHQLKDALRAYLPAGQMEVVHNGILADKPAAPEKQPPSRDKEVVFGMVGSLNPSKGIADAIQALAQLKASGITGRLLVAGDGLERNKVAFNELATSLGVTHQIEWLGYLDDPSIVYQRSHIVLICSRWESFGRVAVEAGAWGCPVVASNKGGLLEVIEEEKTGLFYEPGDVEGLVAKIKKLVDRPNLYHVISLHAPVSVYNRFSTRQYIERMVQVMQRQIEEKASV